MPKSRRCEPQLTTEHSSSYTNAQRECVKEKQFSRITNTIILEPGQLSRYRDGLWANDRGLIPIICTRFISSGSEATYPPIRRVSSDLPPGLKQPRRESYHSLPSSTVVRNYAALPPLPSKFHGVLLKCAWGQLYLSFNKCNLETLPFTSYEVIGNTTKLVNLKVLQL
jgi:hypothetical protein